MIEKVLKRFCSNEVCLLLERIESHPEEFYSEYSKWGWVLTAQGFSVIEKYLIKNKRKYVARAKCRAGILETLVGEPGQEPYFSTTSRFNAGPVKTKTEELAEAYAKHQNKLIVSKSMLAAIKAEKE
jgi:hypothetical protein